MSDEEIKFIRDYLFNYICVDDIGIEDDFKFKDLIYKLLNLIEKQSKEIEELKIIADKYEDLKILYENQISEIEELKEDRKNYAEEYIHNNPWLYKQLNENYILRVESEQKEKQAYIDGTNIADKLCNKKWKCKIKAKIEELDREIRFEQNEKIIIYLHKQKRVLQSLLEKE